MNTLASIAPQLGPGDELLVLCNLDGDSGIKARNDLLERAHGTHLAFLDDDDEWLPGALAAMRRFADENPGRIGIFRMKYELHGLAPRRNELYATATVMYVVPNIRGKVGRFKTAPEDDPHVRDPLHYNDYAFIKETVELQGTEPIYRPQVTTVIRPEKSPLKRLRYRIALRTRILRALGRISRLRRG